MDQTAPAHELERRKLLKIRLRADLTIEAQKYEGRTYYVVKDPVSLRYYRLKDNEYFLLQFLDGKRTLEEAQKAYEKQYRPDRLKLEDLEGFAQQLLTAGLAQSDSPRAGKQLYDRRTKRKRSEWMQTLTNILYIKIPVIDPDRILAWMLRYVSWVFTTWFFTVSVGVMLGAALLVATHFELFRSKLPSYHEFFSFKTVVYLWVALGAVKIIHEFGHGLSCKVFGGEVHEMGALFLCFSPALYCNVSDAWTLPSKWHRIIISAAGIYVELIIAAISTFVWWNTPSQPFINNLALSLMIVCSVSTVVFNANPLMRYDGYYVLADWLEIPNLRERSNRFLKNLVLEYCLGIEVVPEGYMALWRRVLFVLYAIVSYIYRWVVTFAILWFMYSFLRPYKLEVISTMLAFAAAGSMVGWPLYRLISGIRKRGRLPDMKRTRVLITTAVLTALILFVCLVPVPVSRVRGVGLVQAHPESSAQVFLRYSGILERLHVKPGDKVRKGDVLAEFSNRDLEAELGAARTEYAVNDAQLKALEREKELTTNPRELSHIEGEMRSIAGKRRLAAIKVEGLLRIKREDLVLAAPRDGVIGQALRIDEIGKYFGKDVNQQPQALFTINEPRRVRIVLPVVTPEFNQLKENLERPSERAEATFKLLKKRVTVDYQNTRLADVLGDLSRQVHDLNWRLDPNARLTGEQTITFKANKLRLSRVLDRMFQGYGLGYVVLSDPKDEHDGEIIIKAGHERGYPEMRPMADLKVTLRIHGRDSRTWKGRIMRLPEQDAKNIPLALSNRAGGPVAVKPPAGNSNVLIPQTQYYLVYVDIIDPDDAIVPGNMAQVKIHCRPETCLHWLWRTVNNLFDLGLI